MKKNMEKINAQKNINAEAIRHYQLAYAEYNSLQYGYKPARLRSCSATVYLPAFVTTCYVMFSASPLPLLSISTNSFPTIPALAGALKLLFTRFAR